MIILSIEVYHCEIRDMLSISMSEEIFRINWIEVENRSVDQKKVTSINKIGILILMKCSVCRQVT